jgi:hypothetical protein
MADVKNYKYCQYSTLSGVTVTLSSGATTTTTGGFWLFGSGCDNTGTTRQFTMTLSHALPVDLKVYYTVHSVLTCGDFCTSSDTTGTVWQTIPAGQTVHNFDREIYFKQICVSPPNNQFVSIEDGHHLVDQPTLPTECTSQPLGCTVGYSGYIITAPSGRGIADGTVQFNVTGTTGTSIQFKLDGVTQHTGNITSYTFTGITAGLHTIIALDGYCYTQVADVVMPDGQFSTGTMVVSSPAALTASNNPVVLQVQTAANSGLPTPSKGKITILSFAGTINNGDTITVNLSYPQQYTAVFTAADYPDSNTKFLSHLLKDYQGNTLGSNDVNEIATSIAECFQQDIVLRRLYYITNDANNVYFTARENNPALNVTPQYFDLSNTVGMVLSTMQNGVSAYDGQLTAGYSVYAEVYVDQNLQYGETPVKNNFIRVAELELPFQSDNKHLFQLESVLKNYCDTSRIDFNFTGFTTLPNYDTAYFIKYGEKFPLITNSSTKKKRYKGKTGYLTTTNAALDYEVPNNLSTYLGTELTGLTPTSSVPVTFPRSGVTFLTNSPQTLYVQRDSKQYLSFFLRRYYASSQRTLSCKGDVYFYNGTSIKGVKFFQITSGSTQTNFGGHTLLSVGYDSLGLAAYESSGNTKVRRVDFAVYQTDVNGNYPLTKTKTYLYEIDEAPTRFGTAFLNKLGAWDIYDWVGEIVSSEDVSREGLQKPRQIFADGSTDLGFESNSVFNTQYTPRYTVNSGVIDASTYEWLQELLQTNRIYGYTLEHQNFLIVDSYQSSQSSNTQEFSIQVTFRESLYENNVSV